MQRAGTPRAGLSVYAAVQRMVDLMPRSSLPSHGRSPKSRAPSALDPALRGDLLPPTAAAGDRSFVWQCVECRLISAHKGNVVHPENCSACGAAHFEPVASVSMRWLPE